MLPKGEISPNLVTLFSSRKDTIETQLILMGYRRPLFNLFFSLLKQKYNFRANKCAKLLIEYPVPGFELRISSLSVSSQNHWTRVLVRF